MRRRWRRRGGRRFVSRKGSFNGPRTGGRWGDEGPAVGGGEGACRPLAEGDCGSLGR
ncbi:predicted protein [Streptomyces sp. SPB78]|nr:predicted protein [Streptomyces sp. SPB78]